MGLYKEVEYFKANGLLGNNHSDLIFIYKITCTHTGQYYIGRTNDLKNRVYHHLTKILSCIDGDTKDSLHFHREIAIEISKLYEQDKRKKISTLTRNCLEIYVMAIISDGDAANLLESHYISKNTGNHKFLNIK